MTHDPRCPSLRYVVLGGRVCVCETIAQVRQDMLGKCIAAVEWLHDHEAPHDAHKDALWNAITALRALQGKPTPPPLPPSQGIPEKRGSLRRTKKDGKP